MTNPSNPSVDGAESAGGGLDAPLGCTVRINHITFGAGVKLATLVDAATRWHSQLIDSPRNPQEGDAIALSASDAACYRWPGEDEGPIRDAFVQGAEWAARSPRLPVGVSTAAWAGAILRPLAFRLKCREAVGEGIAIGEGLRRDLEHALSRAADLLEAPPPLEEGESLAFVAHRAFVSGYRCAQEDANRSHPGGEEAHWQEHQRVHPILAALSPRDAPGEVTGSNGSKSSAFQLGAGGNLSSSPGERSSDGEGR